MFPGPGGGGGGKAGGFHSEVYVLAALFAYLIGFGINRPSLDKLFELC